MDPQVKGRPLFAASNAVITGQVFIGSDVGIWFGAVIRADGERITIGDRSNIQDNSVIHTHHGHPVLIGSDVTVGHGAILHGCTIRDRVLVGMGAIILNGAIIGEGSIIGAGAVVTEGSDIPERSLVMGVPARIIRQTTSEQILEILKNAADYVAEAKEYTLHV